MTVDGKCKPVAAHSTEQHKGLRIGNGGYNSKHFDPEELRSIARNVADKLPDIMEELGAKHVVVTGKSGVSIAYAASMLVDLPIVVVRKPGENSHGNEVEAADGTVLSKYIILDDFVCSGDTVRRVVSQIDELADRRVATVECVGVVSYLRRSSNRVTARFNPHVTVDNIGILER